MTERPATAPVDSSSDSFVRDPAPHYAVLRETCPISWQPRSNAWLIARYDDAVAALRNPHMAHVGILRPWFALRDRHGIDFPNSIKVVSAMAFNYEGDAHTVMRRTFAKAIAPFANVQDRFRAAADRLLDKGRREGRFDFAEDFANRLLFEIICDLSDINAADRPTLYPMSRLSWAADAEISIRERRIMEDALRDVLELLRDRAPAILERSPDGLLASMRGALPDDEPDKTEATIVNFCVMLMMGNDALGGSFAFAVRWLLDEARTEDERIPQSQWGELADEIFRFSAPVDFLSRFATGDTSVGGVEMASGDRLLASPLGGNHDSSKFGPNAESVCPHSQQGVGLTFGAGRHLCVGMQMSRSISQSAMQALAELPEMALAGPTVQARGKIIRTLESMPVVLT
ncbi:cytochrome P450 [Bauldia sp.]|uniref:cytochrome P450 n=1 Tax=Bauldia sp. TaxID=2575872 RepID=UPI003BA8B7EB